MACKPKKKVVAVSKASGFGPALLLFVGWVDIGAWGYMVAVLTLERQRFIVSNGISRGASAKAHK